MIWQAMIWGGAALTAIGLVGLGLCVTMVLRARRAGLDDDAMRATLRRVVAINLGAVALSALGLMLVVLGVMLG